MGRIYGFVVATAVAVLLGEILPMKLIAEAALAFCFAAALHALLFRWYAWMYRTSWRELLARWVSDHTVYRVGVLLMASYYFLGVVHEHGSVVRALVVEVAFFVGVWITLHPREVKRGLVEGLRERL
jgi:hypothetical protein